MPSLYDLKPALQRWLHPLVGVLAKRGVTPNQLTLLALSLCLVVGALLTLFPTVRLMYLLVPFTLLARMMLNALDGMLAREHGLESPLGAFLNELGDVVSDAALYLPFALITASPAVVIVVLLAAPTEMTGVTARALGGARRYDGPMGKGDRALAFGVLALVLLIWTPPPPLLALLWSLLIVLLALTVFNRLLQALREIA